MKCMFGRYVFKASTANVDQTFTYENKETCVTQLNIISLKNAHTLYRFALRSKHIFITIYFTIESHFHTYIGHL